MNTRTKTARMITALAALNCGLPVHEINVRGCWLYHGDDNGNVWRAPADDAEKLNRAREGRGFNTECVELFSSTNTFIGKFVRNAHGWYSHSSLLDNFCY